MRGSARKARLVADQIRGKGVEDALVTLDFSDKRAGATDGEAAAFGARQRRAEERAREGRDRRRQPGGSHLLVDEGPSQWRISRARRAGVLGSEAFAPHHRGAGARR